MAARIETFGIVPTTINLLVRALPGEQFIRDCTDHDKTLDSRSTGRILLFGFIQLQ